MNNNYENKILDAIQTLVDNAVTKAGYDKTIKAVISKCVNESTGKYVVRYQDSSFYAYSNDLDSIYSGGTPVYVLVPGNDMSQTKTILGSVDKLGTEYITLSESNAAYQEVGTSVITPNGAIPGISSYKAGGDSLVIYDRTSSNNLVNVDLEGIELYFQQSNYMEIGGTFTTRLPEEQKRKGNYGLVFDMDFFNGEETVNKQYVLDINSMTGNPYSYNLGSEQNAIFEIDGANFDKLNSITLECKNFPKNTVPYTNDIFVENIVLKALTPLTRDELANNSLTFTTKQGIYFNENDSASATRLIETEVKINKKVVPNTGGLLRFYWFKEDSTIGITSADYLPFGGPGWRCLNQYNVIDETNNVRDYITDVDTLTVVKSGNPAKENEYKCVVIYNNEIQVERNIIIYNTTSEYTITIESDQGNYFKYNEGNPTLTCSVNPAGTYTYIWTETNSANRTEVLSETSNSYSVQLGSIANFSKFTCSVFSNGNFLGKSNIVITNSWDPEDNSYAIVMENGDQIFKYNEKGIAPTNKSLEKPIVLKPLQFTIYDEFGHEVDDNKISATDVSWYVPKEDTMIKVTTTGITPVEEDGYLIYSGVKTLNFEIASVYNNKKMNNAIKLNVRYNDRVLNTTSELEFIKEGEIGSNGTDFVCRIIPNVAANAQVPNYPIYTYNTTTSTGAMNYTLAANNKWFKVQLYKDGVQIYEGVASGTSEESKVVTIAWSMLKNKYSSTVSDGSSFNVNSNTGEFSYVSTNLEKAANIVKVTVTYDNATYYATMPIIFVKVANADYRLDLENNTGFRYVMYTTDGLNPVYDSSNPFAIIAYNGTTDITNNNNITFTYSTLGQTYDGTTWVNENNFITKAHGASNPLAKNEADYRPIEKFDGLSVNNAVKCIVKESGSEIARIYLPIHFYLNRFGNAALNGWDGNHVEINSNGGFILAPQIGAGKKEQDNSYTGVFMGSVREAGSSEEEVGLFGYKSGVRTLELNAEDGSAKFGKQGAGRIIIDPGTGDYSGKGTAKLYSDDYSITYTKPSDMVPAQTKYTAGYSYWRKVNTTEYKLLREGTDYTIGQTIAVTDYVWSNGSGLEIDLNDPHIRFGSGKFRVDSDGQVYATGFVTVNNLEAGDYNIPSGSIDVGSGDTLNDYIYDTNNTLVNLQNQIDGAIQFWNGQSIPTLNNYPAEDWTTEEERRNHQADIYTVIYDEQGEWKQGKSYRFDKVNGSWIWIELTDQEMSAVQALAASKAKVFVATPYVPYSIGDLWLKDGKDLYRCKTAKDSAGSYSASDWELATDYTNDDRADAAYSKAEDAETAIQGTVKQVDVEYGVSTSSTTPPSSWSTASPVWEEGKYVWSRQKITYVNDTTATRNAVCIQGAKGEDGQGGQPGTDGANTATIYLYKRSASAPTSSLPYSSNATYTFADQSLSPAPSNSWTTSVPTGTNPLYVTVAVAYSNTATDTIGASEWSTPVKFVENGVNGHDGRGISSTEVKYVADTQGVTPPADSANWSSNPPSGDNKGKFIWTRTRITYTDNQNPTTSYSVSYEGTNGEDGDSITITSQAIEYAQGDTGTSHPTSGWSTTIPSVPDGKYLWTRTTVNYSDNTTTVSYSASYQSKDGTDGQSATNVVCGNEAQIIPCDKDGKVSAQTDITIPFAGYLGSTRKACSVTVTGLPSGMTVQSNTSATTSADGSLVLRAAANSTLGDATAGTITLTFGCNALTFIKKFAWSKSIEGADANGTWTATAAPTTPNYTFAKSALTGLDRDPMVGDLVYYSYYRYTISSISDTTVLTGNRTSLRGATGAAAYTLVLSNESHTFPATDTHAVASSTTIDVTAYKGTTVQTPTIGTITGQVTGLTTSVSGATITVSAAETLTTTDGELTIPITVDGQSFTKKFSWSLAKAGTDGTSPTAYSLIVSHAAIAKTQAGVYNPTSLTFSATSQTGNAAITTYTGGSYRITKDGGTAGSWTNLSSSNTYNVTNNTPSTSVKIELAKENASSSTHTIVDAQTVPVVKDGKGISSITNYYLATSVSSGVTRETSGWTTTIQTMTETNKYLWNYEDILYNDNSHTYSDPTIIGVYGATGAAGKGISAIDEYYAINNSSTTAPADTDFSTTVVSPTSAKPYLWNYEKITYINPSSTVNTTKHVIGHYGKDGENGKSIVVDTTTVTYQNSTNGTTIPTGTWTSSPSPEEGKYTWTKTVTTYKLSGTSTSAGSSTSYSVAYTGPKGDQGRSLVKQTPLHYLKSNDTVPVAPTSHVTSTSTEPDIWTTAMPEYVDGYTYFACSENEFNEVPLYEWTNVVKDNGLNDALTIANQAKDSVDELVDAIDNPTNTMLGQKYFDIIDAAEKPLVDFKMYGETQQDSTTGKNLVDFDNYTSLYNATYDSTTKILTSNALNGDWTGMGINNYNTPTKVEVGTNIYYYSLDVRIKSGTYSSGNLNFFANGDAMANVSRAVEAIQNPTLSSSFQRYIFKITYTNNSGSETQTLNNFIQLKYGANNAVIEAKNFMISTTNSDYEPYTNGASPNPDYPQFIHNVSGDNTIEICGKNLFDKSKVTSGKIVYRETGELGQNNSYSATDYIPIKANVTYTQSNFNYYYSAYYNKNKEYISECGLATFTPSQDGYIRTTVANTNLDIAMIEVGSTASTYEAYTSNSQLISLGVENLFDSSTFVQGDVKGDNPNIRISSRQEKYIQDGTYTFSTNLDLSVYRFIIATLPNKPPSTSYNELFNTGWRTTSPYSITIPSNQKGYLCIYISKIDNSNVTIEELANYNFQLEKGSKANSYSPYGASYIELNKISTYQDYIYKDNDRWFLHKEIGKVVLDGSESWGNFDTTRHRSNITYTNLGISPKPYSSDCLSNYFVNANTEQSIGFNLGSSALYLRIDDTFTNITQFKNWLSTNKPIFYLPLATFTDTEITDTTLLEQLNNLMTLPLYKNMTHITLTANDLNPDMDIEYIKDNVINNNFVTSAEMGQTKEEISNIQEIANAAYAQAQSTLITYTITDTANEPGDSATWSNVLPSAPDKYIWQRIEYKFLDSSKDYFTQPTCIYTPTRVTNELQYCLCSQNNYDSTKITNDWQSEPFPWDDSYASSASPTEIEILRYQFVRNKYTDTNKTEDAVSYSTPILDQAWYMFGKKLASESFERQLLSNNINNNIVSMDSQNGLIVKGRYTRQGETEKWYGIRLTSFGIQFLTQGLTNWEDLTDEMWKKVWNIDGTLDTEYITVVNLNADNILSGTLTLKTNENNGSFILNSTYGESTRIDGNGVKVTNIGGDVVHIKTAAKEGISATYKSNDQNIEYFNVNPDKQLTTMTNSSVTNECAFGSHIKVVQITNGIAFIGI